MGLFIIMLLVPVAIQHISTRRNEINYEKKNTVALTFFFCVLTLLVALRHKSVGNDTANYIFYFKSFAKMDWETLGRISIEVGYSYFNKLVSFVSTEPQVFLAVVAVAVSVMIYPTYRRVCIDSSLTIMLFVTMSTFFMMFSGLRQLLAISIGFVAYEFTRRKKLIPFILMVFLAMTFHTSAFILVFMYPIYHAKITKKWLLAVVPVLSVVFIFNKQIFVSLSLLLEQYTRFEGDITETGAYTMLFLFAIFTVFAFIIPDETTLDQETIGMRNFLLFSLVLQMFAPLHSLAMRMNYYYIIFIPLLLPKIIACRSERWSQVAIVARYVMVVFFFAYFFLSANGGGNLNVFPYHFFWESV